MGNIWLCLLPGFAPGRSAADTRHARSLRNQPPAISSRQSAPGNQLPARGGVVAARRAGAWR